MGLGATSCGKFAELYRMDATRADEEFIDWVQGFMSGLNMALLLDKPPGLTKNLAAKSVKDHQQWMRTYCDQHPLSSVEQGALQLFFSLPNNPPVHP